MTYRRKQRLLRERPLRETLEGELYEPPCCVVSVSQVTELLSITFNKVKYSRGTPDSARHKAHSRLLGSGQSKFIYS